MTPGESHNEWYQYYCSNICPFKEDLIFLTKFSMAAKFIKKIIFLRGIDVQNLKVSFIYLNIGIICF